MALDAKQIVKRFEAAKARKLLWDELYEDGMTYVAPNRDIFFGKGIEKGRDKSNAHLLFDSTAQDAHSGFVSNLQSSLVPPKKRWILLKTGNAFPEMIPDESGEMKMNPEKSQLDLQLAMITNTMFDFIDISNFDVQVSTSFFDLGFGVGALMLKMGTKQNPFHFESVHIANLYLEEGPNGRIDVSFRHNKIQARNILGTWDDAKIDTELQEIIDTNSDREIELVEGTFPSDADIFDKKQNKRVKKKGFRYVVIDREREKIIVDREQESSPWIIFRWPTIPGEIYARGPIIKALADIKTINKVKELLLKAASLNIHKPLLVANHGVVNVDNIRVGPGAKIPVESNGGHRGPTIVPFPDIVNVPLAQFVFNELKLTIQKMLFAEPLGPIDMPVKTATEIAFRQQELAKRIGSAFGRLQFELMVPLVNRMLFILEQFGYIDLKAFRVDGDHISIDYVSPLAQAQDMEDVNAMVGFVQTLQGLFGPEVATILTEMESFVNILGKKMNVPPEIIPSPQSFKALREAMQQRIAVQSAAETQALQNGGGQAEKQAA